MTPAAKIGLLMVIGLIILGVFIVEIEDIPIGERGERRELAVRFDSVAGLDQKAAVRIAGVRVGKVESVGLDDERALLRLSLQPDVRLYGDASAKISSLGMLGEKYVEVLPGHPAAGSLPEGAVLEGSSVPTFDQVLEVATDIGGDIKEVSATLRRSLGGPEGAEKLTEIVDNLQELTASLNRVVAENRSDVSVTTDNFRHFSNTLKTELPRIAEKMNRLADSLHTIADENRDDLNDSLTNIRELSERLQVSADNLNRITGKIADGDGTIGKLVHEDRTVDNFNETLDSIEGGVDTLRNTIGRWERFRLNVAMETETMPDVDESRTSVGIDLWTTPRRFFRVQYVDAPFGERNTTTETVTTTFADGSVDTYTRTTLTIEDEARWNAQVGFRLRDDLVVRAGLFESEGGVGISKTFRVVERPLRLSLSAYDFDRDIDESPHLRFEGRYFLNDNIFLSAGWDDPMFSDRSSVLVGGGVTWLDEDVKYLLGLAGSGL